MNPERFVPILPGRHFAILLALCCVAAFGPGLLGVYWFFTNPTQTAFTNLYLILLGLLLLAATNLWLVLITCFEGAVPALLFLAVPGYQPYYVYTRWLHCRQPVWIMLISIICLLNAYAFMSLVH